MNGYRTWLLGLAQSGWPKLTHGFHTGHDPAMTERTKARAWTYHWR